jgi:hypothetical protein
VSLRGDTLDEADETFFVRLSAPTRATISKGTGQGTILDDDPPPSIAVGDSAIPEGDSGTTSASFTVMLSAPSGQVVTVAYSTADGTATAGSDYTPTSGTLTFAPGQTSLTIAIPVVGDTLDEADETFFVNLSGPTNAVIADPQGAGTIADDDTPPSLSIDSPSIAEGDAGSRGLTFTVSLSAPSGRTVTVSYATAANGSATADTDFTTTSGSLTFLPGTRAQTITVPIVGDPIVEPDENFLVNLSAPINASILAGQGVGTILNDDVPTPPPAMSVSDATVTEGDSGSAGAIFTVTLSAASNQIVTVSYTTANSTATAGSDYVLTSGSLTFLPGQTSQTISVPVLGDTIDEPNEFFFLRLSNPGNATIADGQGLGTIVDDDPSPSLSIGDATVIEGNTGSRYAVFTVTLSAPTNQYVGFSYSTANGSATAGSDYTAVSGGLTFLPGQTSQTISVPVLGDTVDEPDETFFLRLSNPGNATIADGLGVGTIVDDDPTPNLSFTIQDASVVEGNSGTSFLVFHVLLSGPSNSVEWAVFTTADGTAKASDGDYTPQSTETGITFLAGVTDQTISIPIFGDTSIEPDEEFFVNLTRASRPIDDNQAVGTIINDD